ncbi:MAG: DUF5985 family protein [Bdellovibrionia bacterium]
MAEAVYILCAITSLGCATFLVRGYRRSRTRLLMWSAACFLFLAASNIMLIVDLVITGPTIDLLPYRLFLTLVGTGMLVYGLIEEAV